MKDYIQLSTGEYYKSGMGVGEIWDEIGHTQFDIHFGVAGIKFDYALAQLVFTHLPWNSIRHCLYNVSSVMELSGELIAIFFEDDTGNTSVLQIPQEGGVTFMYKDPYHYNFQAFENLAQRTKLQVTYIGGSGHLRHQKMLMFPKVIENE